ncbi:MAG: hypothetical protein HKM07_02380 [Chlamydiae bacterium]|nr:hypothetical protein [Chlamydiota bacterium]
MESYLFSDHYDLVTPDGRITHLTHIDKSTAEATVFIEKISPAFVGFQIEKERVIFNIKSTLAQLGLNGIGTNYIFEPKNQCAYITVTLQALDPIAVKILEHLAVGAYIGKLFAADERRRVRDPEYLLRMFGRADRSGNPLLSLGGLQGSDDLILEKIQGRAVAFISLKKGILEYDSQIENFIPSLTKALLYPSIRTRNLLQIHQVPNPNKEREVKPGKILLVQTPPLHIRTVFGKVTEELLPEGYHHTSASVLQPDTRASGDIYELFGNSTKGFNDIPLEFYTLEPHREHVFFADRDQLQDCLEKPDTLFKAFETAPINPIAKKAAVFIVKGEQLLKLSASDWIIREHHKNEFPGLIHPTRQALMVERYIEQQPSYPFLKSIEDGLITSEGILLTRYFPSPLMKRMLINDIIQRFLKGIYFQFPSLSHGNFFSHEDRSFLLDLAKFAIPVYWVDESSDTILQYIPRSEKDSGMFVPQKSIQDFLRATFFGIYGSNLIEGDFEKELTALLKGILQMREETNHPLLQKGTPVALVTGGGPGSMELGNRVAKSLQILSCANIIDFGGKENDVINEQKQNPYIDAKMTYRLDRLVERQAEFNLDFPILLSGGIGTDFEFTLEEVRRKVGSSPPSPVLLFGEKKYWQEKITTRFQCNLAAGTIKGSEWVSNCFYCIQTAKQGLEIYRKFFQGTLPIGKNGPVFPDGFCDTF